MEPKTLTVTLLDSPRYPLPTLFTVWEASRHDRPVMHPAELQHVLNTGKPTLEFESMLMGYNMTLDAFWSYYRHTTRRLLFEAVPTLEFIDMIFLIENMPIWLREQMVRHRIGTRYGNRLGIDIIPEFVDEDTPFWSQSGRTLDMSSFATEGRYDLPKSINPRVPVNPNNRAAKYLVDLTTGQPMDNPNVEELYIAGMRMIETIYTALVDSGVPAEDARNLIPYGATHRLAVKWNLMAMKHIIGKRSCWLFQSMWSDVIKGTIDEVCTNVDEVFRVFVNPPCIGADDEWKGCPFKQTNIERIQGRDPLPPCPLFLEKEANKHGVAEIFGHGNTVWIPPSPYDDDYGVGVTRRNGWPFKMPNGWRTKDLIQASQAQEMRRDFADLWWRDVDTGEPNSEWCRARAADGVDGDTSV